MDMEVVFWNKFKQLALTDILRILVVYACYLQLFVQMDKSLMEMDIAFLFLFILFVQLDMRAMEMEIACWLLHQQKILNQQPTNQLKNLLLCLQKLHPALMLNQ